MRLLILSSENTTLLENIENTRAAAYSLDTSLLSVLIVPDRQLEMSHFVLCDDNRMSESQFLVWHQWHIGYTAEDTDGHSPSNPHPCPATSQATTFELIQTWHLWPYCADTMKGLLMYYESIISRYGPWYQLTCKALNE